MNKKILALPLIFILICSTSCSQQGTRKKPKVQAGIESSVTQMGDIARIKILNNNTNIKSGCSGTQQVLTTADSNQTYDVLNKVGDWYAVKLPNNSIGFVPTSQCKPIIASNKTTSPSPSATIGTAQGQPTTNTPTTPGTSTSLTKDEQQILTLVNQARAQNNAKPLKIDFPLESVSRTKAQDMIDNKYFSHNSPKYGSPFDMMKNFGIKYLEAGENIAGNQSATNAFNAWMNSPGHRKNILNPDFTDMGIGIRSGGPYGMMFSQMFISK